MKPPPRVLPFPAASAAPPATGHTLRLSQVVGALSCALDITEGQPEGHAARSCLIGMEVARRLKLGDADRSALFYALQLKDLGCSSNAEKVARLFGGDELTVKQDFKTSEWASLTGSLAYIFRNLKHHGWGGRLKHFARIGVEGQRGARKMVQIRCERGAAIARLFDLPEATARAIYDLDEHWDGRGHPEGKRRDAIDPLARIAGLAQTVEVFAAEHGIDAALRIARRRRGRWFDPKVADAFLSIGGDPRFWAGVYGENLLANVRAVEPPDRRLHADDDRLDRIALGFAQVVDAKSSWTRRHSERVTELAVGIAARTGADADTLRWYRRAALLHDVGKLGVSSAILDKPGRLTDDELAAMRRHPEYTHRVLSRIDGFDALAETAASHHERLDGRGYHRGLTAADLSAPVRAMVVADMFEAMTAERPYRDTMPFEKVFGILDEDTGTAVCGDAVAALKDLVATEGYEPGRLAGVGAEPAGAAETQRAA